MIDHRSSHAAAAGQISGSDAAQDGTGEGQAALRKLGGHAHQLRAATQAADHFMGLGRDDDHNTGSWLVACAVDLASELAAELDAIDGAASGANGVAAAVQVRALRTRAHQLHAAARAADHYLDQDQPADRDTGSWLIACARGLAAKLAADFDDSIGSRRNAVEGVGLGDVIDSPLRRLSPARPPRGTR